MQGLAGAKGKGQECSPVGDKGEGKGECEGVEVRSDIRVGCKVSKLRSSNGGVR